MQQRNLNDPGGTVFPELFELDTLNFVVRHIIDGGGRYCRAKVRDRIGDQLEDSLVRLDLKGSVAVVIGGSGGIGAATVRMLADAGAIVVVGFNKAEERAKQLIEGLSGTGHSTVRVALEEAETVKKLAEHVDGTYGRADILVNSAGFTHLIAHRDLDALTDAIFDSILIANVRGPFSIIRALTPLLMRSGDAVIVNVSSISAFTGSGSSIAYCAAKAALDTMTLSLARALGPKIRVMCVSPGAVATGFVASRGRTELEKIAQSTPMKRIVEAEDVAAAVMACITYLCASTGTKIIVDGGRFLA